MDEDEDENKSKTPHYFQTYSKETPHTTQQMPLKHPSASDRT